MEAIPTLTSLPNELLTVVAEQSASTDLLSLRIICKQVTAAIDSTFLQTFFSIRRHLLTRHGLQLLVEITKDKRLRRRLTEIDLVVPELGFPYNPHLRIDYPFFADETGVQTIVVPTEADKARRKHEEMVWSKWEAEKAAFDADGSAITHALRNLVAAGLTPKLALSDTAFSRRPGQAEAYGTKQLANQLGPPFERSELTYSISIVDITRAGTALLAAIAQAEYSVTSLDLYRTSYANGITPRLFDVGHEIVDRLRFCWTNLTKLELHLNNSEHRVEARERAAFCQLMASAVSLVELTISSDGWLDMDEADQYFTWVSAAFANGKLKMLDLSGIRAHRRTLLAFFTTHRHTICDLRLSFLYMKRRRDWLQVFAWLAEHMALGNIELHLTNRYDEGLFIRERGHATEVKQQLLALAKTSFFD